MLGNRPSLRPGRSVVFQNENDPVAQQQALSFHTSKPSTNKLGVSNNNSSSSSRDRSVVHKTPSASTKTKRRALGDISNRKSREQQQQSLSVQKPGNNNNNNNNNTSTTTAKKRIVFRQVDTPKRQTTAFLPSRTLPISTKSKTPKQQQQQQIGSSFVLPQKQSQLFGTPSGGAIRTLNGPKSRIKATTVEPVRRMQTLPDVERSLGRTWRQQIQHGDDDDDDSSLDLSIDDVQETLECLYGTTSTDRGVRKDDWAVRMAKEKEREHQKEQEEFDAILAKDEQDVGEALLLLSSSSSSSSENANDFGEMPPLDDLCLEDNNRYDEHLDDMDDLWDRMAATAGDISFG